MTPAAGSDRYEPDNFVGWLSVDLARILVPRKFGKFGKFGKFNLRTRGRRRSRRPRVILFRVADSWERYRCRYLLSIQPAWSAERTLR
jgi:hypothetical protein